jgi:hypothetical protein
MENRLEELKKELKELKEVVEIMEEIRGLQKRLDGLKKDLDVQPYIPYVPYIPYYPSIPYIGDPVPVNPQPWGGTPWITYTTSGYIQSNSNIDNSILMS